MMDPVSTGISCSVWGGSSFPWCLRAQ